MQTILTKLNELVGICESRVSKLDQEKAELAGKRATLESQRKSQETEQESIKAQNEALDKRKLLVKTIDEAKASLKANAEESKRLKVQSDEFDKKKSDHEKKMAEDRAYIEDQKKKCAAMNAETERKAKEYKKEVMAEILKNSEKK